MKKGESIAIAIMAAGKGTRLKSKHPKVLHEIGGKALLRHVIEAAAQVVPIEDVYAIIGYEAELVRKALGDTGVKFILQEEQRGTGHAIMCGREELKKYEHVLVLSGDTPLIRPEVIERLRDFHLQKKAAMTILTAVPPDPFGFGRIVRKKKGGKASDEVQAIVEQKAANKQQLKIGEINTGIYAFASKPLFENIDKLSTDNAHREYYLTDMAVLLGKAKQKVLAVKAGEMAEALGVNSRAELVRLDAQIRAAKCTALMDAGVTIYKPETCTIDADVEIGTDTVIEPFVQLLGKTKVGSDCRIRSGSVIENSAIGDGVLVRQGTIMDSASVHNEAIIGPYSHLRPGSEISEKAHVGNFVETKKVKLGKGSKANHLTYLGDSVIGAGVNIGAGTITCNYDGVNKHTTTIEDGVFVGSDSTLVAPVKLGKGSYVGAGSCITDEVPADALAIGRGRQINKEGWAKAKREAMAAAKKS
ncbi:MAG TPA: bifunctional UDP-N-acetylglucosamine diphosphorylase/glucosamine-1-phosphate N-acetyltransferase GlmU [Terriglobales bacterium]|nr:bifunctional UDP-N-acetylglucosamine diphosphorylase/glucosamine-1-phosphate N-acetyltransferase GlmU [Terriglobales bacterium]